MLDAVRLQAFTKHIKHFALLQSLIVPHGQTVWIGGHHDHQA